MVGKLRRSSHFSNASLRRFFGSIVNEAEPNFREKLHNVPKGFQYFPQLVNIFIFVDVTYIDFLGHVGAGRCARRSVAAGRHWRRLTLTVPTRHPLFLLRAGAGFSVAFFDGRFRICFLGRYFCHPYLLARMSFCRKVCQLFLGMSVSRITSGVYRSPDPPCPVILILLLL